MGVTEKLDGVPPDTDRLAFREWNDDDLDRFHAICSEPKVMQFVGDGQAWTRNRTGQFGYGDAARKRILPVGIDLQS